MLSKKRTGIAAMIAAGAMVVAACGGAQPGGGGNGDGSGGSGNIIMGTTDSIPSLDPAKCYSYMCGAVVANVGDTLVTYLPGETEVSPDIAAALPEISDDGLTYTFEIKKGLTFHDGSELTSKDVKFSYQRVQRIHHPDGAYYMLSGIKSMETPDPHTLVIHLEQPDTTFVTKLASPYPATIVPSDAGYPMPEKTLPEDASAETLDKYIKNDLIASGQYKLAEHRQGESVLLKAFDDYTGQNPAKADKFLMQFYDKAAQLQSALQAGDIDVAYRHLEPTQRKSLQSSEDMQVVAGTGAFIRYMVLNPHQKPFGDVDVRRAIAAAIDGNRQRIIGEVVKGAGEPLYSMVPPFFEKSHVPAFKNRYEGKKPSDYIGDRVVEFELWYGLNHYGDTEPALAQEIQRVLEETGSFKVTLKSAQWTKFSENNAGKSSPYAAHLLGWYPDYLDPDNYVQPFYDSQGYLQQYSNQKMDRLIRQEQTGELGSQERIQTFGQIQELAAKDTPIVPLHVGTPFVYAHNNISGLKATMDASQLFRFFMLSKSG